MHASSGKIRVNRVRFIVAVLPGPKWLNYSTRIALGKTRATGFPNHEAGLQQDVAGRQIGVLNSLQHGRHGDGSNVSAILVVRGQWYGQHAGVLDVVNSDHANILRDTNSGL